AGRRHSRTPRARGRSAADLARAPGRHEAGARARLARARSARGERTGGRRGLGQPRERVVKTFGRLLRYFRRYSLRALAALVAMAVVSIAGLLMLFLIGKVIDDTLGAGTAASIPGFQAAGRAKTGALLTWLDSVYEAARSAAESRGIPARLAVPGLLLLSLLVKNVFSFISELELTSVGVAMVRDLRRDAYARLLYQSTRFYSEGSTGDLMSRMLSDVEQIQHAFGHNLTDLVQGILTLVALLVYVFSLDARLAIVVFALTPLVLLPIWNNTRRLGRAATAARERIGAMAAL